MNNRNGSTYIVTVSALILDWGSGDSVRLRLITEIDRELVPHVCSYQIMTFDWIRTVT